jgi:ATP-dependent Clp protease ATP-binding subunit ClpC
VFLRLDDWGGSRLGGQSMFVPFTDRVREVLTFAEQEARRLNHEYVGTEHILLGLFKARPGVGVTVLKNLGVDPERATFSIEAVALPGGERVSEERLGQTPRAKQIIQYACQEAYDLNHNYVGTEHLVLGALREQQGVAAQILMGFGVRLDAARQEVLNLLGPQQPSLE